LTDRVVKFSGELLPANLEMAGQSPSSRLLKNPLSLWERVRVGAYEVKKKGGFIFYLSLSPHPALSQREREIFSSPLDRICEPGF